MVRRRNGLSARGRSRGARRADDDSLDPDGRKVLRVLVADDSRLIVAGIRRALEDEDEIEVVGEAANGAEVLPMVGRTDPDVVLLDIRMPKMDGWMVLEQLRARYPRVKVVMLSVLSDQEHIAMALAHGASGYIVKTINPRDLPSALRQAVEGSVYHAIGFPEVTEESEARAAGLTEREVAILKAVARGLSNQAIGKELWVTEQTVKFHLTNIYRKLGVANRTEAARYAYMHHLASVDSESSPESEE
jgi:Response regulator containing a CheY-like receiver domain and an HTH DNA-binding domain